MSHIQTKAPLLQSILDSAIDHKKVFGTSFCVKYQGESWCGASGNLQVEQPYFIASVTKLLVTAVILHYRAKGLLSLEDRVVGYLGSDIANGLNVYKNRDYGNEIIIRHLLAHTSGIPDYFQKKGDNGDSLEKMLMRGIDQKWDFEQAIERSKGLRSTFAPGTKGKAHYSDTNFQLLGKIIETISGQTIGEVFRDLLFAPLGLSHTYLYTDITDDRPKTLYYKRSERRIPQAMSSFGADGGVVSTSREMMVFVEAFFNCTFFPQTYIDEMKVWNRIFFPMQSGIGIQRFRLPWFFDPTGAIPELIGHSGLSGSLAYHNPEKDIYVTGTVNQVAYPDTSFRLMIKLIRKVLKKEN